MVWSQCARWPRSVPAQVETEMYRTTIKPGSGLVGSHRLLSTGNLLMQRRNRGVQLQAQHKH
jgi:hypothetical protein